jgi:hypothetical protein
MANVDKTPEPERTKPAHPTPEQIKHDELDQKLDEALEMSFPASDPIAIGSNDD